MLNDDKLLRHYEISFNQRPLFSIKLKFKIKVDIKIHVFYPTEEYPFYKLATSGCSYLLNENKEYMMFLSKRAPVKKGSSDEEFIFYPLFLLKSSIIGYDQGVDISYYDVSNLNVGKAKGVMFLPPQVVKNNHVLSLSSNGETIKFLQVVPLTKAQYNYAITHNLVKFAEIFYHHDYDDKVISMHPFADDYLRRDANPLFKNYL